MAAVVAEEEAKEEEEVAAGELEEEGEEVGFTFRDFLRLKERCFSFSFSAADLAAAPKC